MILNAFRQLQQEFEELLRLDYPQAMRVMPGAVQTPPMDFLRADYTNISLPLQVSPIRATLTDTDTVEVVLTNIKAFLVEWTTQHLDPAHSRITVSKLYLEYDPNVDGAPTVVRFDFVPWSYDGTVLEYLKLVNDQLFYEQPVWALDSYNSERKSQQHQLMKTQAIEVNVWMQNVVKKMTELDLSAEEFLRTLTDDLREQTEVAQTKINSMYELAHLHDNVNKLLKTDEHAALRAITKVLGKDAEVSIEVNHKTLYFVIDNRYIEPSFLFQYLVLRHQGESNV